MRILGMSKLWPKLAKDQFTTFRYERRDTDWKLGENVQVVYKPRRPGGGVILGIAEIIKKEPRWLILPQNSWLIDAIHKGFGDKIPIVSESEAKIDGFETRYRMLKWIFNNNKKRQFLEPCNKLTLKWYQRWYYHGTDQEIDKQWAFLNENS